MFKIDVPSAAATMPTPADAGTPGFFTEGNPTTGVAPTVVSADFLNMVMMELINLLVAGDIAPSKTNFGQVAAAVLAIAGGSANFASIGHIQLPGGFILNWGNGTTTDASGVQPVAFDLPFPTGPLATFASNYATVGAPISFHGTDAGTKTGMNVHAASSSSAAAPAGSAFFWFALGH